MTHDFYMVKTRTNKHKHTDVLPYVNDGYGLDKCCSIKCSKQQEKYCVSRAKIFTSGDIELNPGPINGSILLQSRLRRVASWLVRLSPDRAVRVRALAGDTVLCSWARHLTLTVPLSIVGET